MKWLKCLFGFHNYKSYVSNSQYFIMKCEKCESKQFL